MKFDSLCIHDAPSNLRTKPQQLPIYATSAFAFESIDDGIAVFKGEQSGHFYSRYANPTIDVVAQKIAALESFGLTQTAEGLMTSSGMAAISTLMIGLLQKGDKILTQGNLYGGTTELFAKTLAPLGIEPIFTDLANLDQVEGTLRADRNIRMIYFETPANPTLACMDVEGIVEIAKKFQVFSAIDNTFATPFLQTPLSMGVDFVIHSTTKYLNGHGNSTAGIIVSRDKELMKQKIWVAMKLLGTNISPFEAWLTNNGLKTFPLRMRKHCDNAQTIAEWLEKHPQIGKVNYPGLASHEDHELAKYQMRNGFGGMLSFELKGGLAAGISMMNRVNFCSLAPTLGDTETLILHPASMSHLNVPRPLREANGITDGLIRLSVGIEDVTDIIADLEQAIG